MSFADLTDDANGGAGMANASPPQSDDSGLPGYPMGSDVSWRAGVPGSDGGALGVVQLAAAGPSGGIPPGYSPVDGRGYYVQDAQGHYYLTPSRAAQTHGGQVDWGNVDWPGVAGDLASIAAGSLPLVGAKAADILKAIPAWGIDTWREVRHDAAPSSEDSKR